MAAEIAKRDGDRTPVMLGVTNDAALDPTMLRVDPSTKRLLVDAGSITTSSASVGSTGAAVPASADYIAGNKAGNLTGLLIGQQAMASSLAVVLSSDQTSIPVAATLAAETTKVIGTINIASAQTLATVTTVGTVTNLAQMNGVAITMGNGGSGTGVQRVTIASDSTGQVVLAAGTAGIGKLTANSGVTIGAVEIAAAQTLATVTTVTTVTTLSTLTNITNWGNIVDNVGFTDGTTRLSMSGYIFDEVAGTALTENDGAAARINANRAQVMVVEDGATRARYQTITTRGSALHEGPTASGVALAAAPVTIGGLAKTANPTAVTDAQVVNALFDKLGKQVVVGSLRDLKGVQQTQISSSTSETTIVTAVASTFLDLYGLIISNTSASVCKVTIKDSTGGTTRAVIEVPATDVRGFMLPESGAIPQATVNNNWTATCGSSVAAIEITALYVKNL